MSFAADFMASAPDEWKRTARRTGSDPRTLRGLFRTEQMPGAAYSGRPPDLLPRFEITQTDAQAFGLAVNDRLLIDGQEFNVTAMVPEDCGTITATLRRFA